MSQPQVEIETITPARALELLATSNGNRSVRKTRVDAYARDIKNHKWRLNTHGIGITEKGELVEGQHRLLACVQANTPFETIVVYGLKAEAHPTIDVGAGRSLADELRWQGEQNVATLGAVLTLVCQYDNDSITKLTNVTRHDALQTLRKNPQVREHLYDARRVADATGVRSSVFAACLYLLNREHGEEVRDEFLQHLEAGVNYEEGDPALALRNYATTVNRSRLTRPNRVEWMAVVIKAMNFYLLGQPISSLRWRRVGPQPEPFPKLLSKEDVNV